MCQMQATSSENGKEKVIYRKKLSSQCIVLTSIRNRMWYQFRSQVPGTTFKPLTFKSADTDKNALCLPFRIISLSILPSLINEGKQNWLKQGLFQIRFLKWGKLDPWLNNSFKISDPLFGNSRWLWDMTVQKSSASCPTTATVQIFS